MADLHPSREIISQSPELPPDLLFFHILPRLPAKSVLRFRCVCKQWRSFLKTPTFSDLHRNHDGHQNRHKILFISTTPPYNFRTIDCEAPEDGLSTARSLPFKAKPENITITASLNGLVCVGIKNIKSDTKYSDLILWNPLTGEYKTLSRRNSDEECYRCTGRAFGGFGLYYSCSEDDYKLLRVTNDCDVCIYSLKSDSWRKVDDHNIQSILMENGRLMHPSVVLNEKLYFLKRVLEGWFNSPPPSYSIITFDMKTEKFREIATPSFENRRIWWLNYMVVRGCIHLYDTYITNGDRVIEMWKMDGDGEGDWRKVVQTYFEIPFFPCCQQLLHVMKNGNWLMHSKKKGYVYKLDLETHTEEELCSFVGMRIPTGGEYIETFVSPDRYINRC